MFWFKNKGIPSVNESTICRDELARTNLQILLMRDNLLEERLQDIEKDIKLTWDYLGVKKSMTPAQVKSYKLTKNK
jgi:hypothetical protein